METFIVVSPMGIPTAPIRSLAISTTGNSSRQLWANTITSASIVERSVHVCNFDCQRTGQFVKVITKHVPPTPKPTLVLPTTPPSKPISYTNKIQRVEQFASKFILAVVEDMWVCCLRDSETFYLEVTPHQLLAHLTTIGGGTDTKNIISLHSVMSTWWADNPHVPEYINKM